MGDFLSVLKKNKRLAVCFFALLVLLLLASLLPGYQEKTDESFSLSEYKAKLEQELSELCSSVDGVGKCYVYITFEKGAENIYKSGELIESRPPRVLGVSVVCKGADSSAVRHELAELFTSIFGIGTNRVKILKLK